METVSKENIFGITDEQLFEKYSATVYRLSLARVSQKAAAEDILQEVFLRAIKNRPIFESEEHCKAWLIKTTVNCSKTYLTSAYRRHYAPLEDRIAEIACEDHRDLLLAVYYLPPKYKTVVHLFYFEDMKTEEISRALGISVSAVKQQLKRARTMLKNLMTGDDLNV